MMKKGPNLKEAMKRYLVSLLLIITIAGYQPGQAQQSAAKPPTVQASKTQSGFCVFPSVPKPGESDLPLVVWQGDMKAVRSRIGPHVKLNLPFPIACDDKQATLLLTATSGKNPEVVEFLLQRGADPNFNPERGIGPPLHRAAYSNNLPAVKILLRYGARLEERNDRGLTPLLSAALNSKGLGIILELLAAGADPHAI